MSPVIGYAKNLDKHPELPNIFCYAWLEGTLAAKLVRIEEMTDWNNLTQWPAGRLFSEAGEYRWQSKPDGKIHGVFIRDVDELPAGFKGQLEIEKIGPDSELILWGDWVNPAKDPEGNPDGGPRFYAREIPRIQTYPITFPPDNPKEIREQVKTPRLIVRRYRHQPCANEEFQGEFIRCVHFGMKSESEEEIPHEKDKPV